jgi:hypothetical protein
LLDTTRFHHHGAAEGTHFFGRDFWGGPASGGAGLDDICQSVMASFFVRAAAGQFNLERPDELIRLLV